MAFPGRAVAHVLVVALVGPVSLLGGGCATVDVKGREALRVGPLRGVAVVPASVGTAPVEIDAGTDALTNEELAAIAARLPRELERAFAERAATVPGGARSVGEATVKSCRLRAGPGRAYTVYEARCRVVVSIDGVAVVDVHAEALRRTRSRAISQDEAARIRKLVRNPLLAADDAALALVAAVEAAATIVVHRALPASDDPPATPALSAEVKRRHARERIAGERIAAADDARAALFDIASTGEPEDARAVLPYLAHEDAAVRATAADALGELCAPWSAERLEPLAVDDAEDPAVQRAAATALTRVRVCRRLTAP